MTEEQRNAKCCRRDKQVLLVYELIDKIERLSKGIYLIIQCKKISKKKTAVNS